MFSNNCNRTFFYSINFYNFRINQNILYVGLGKKRKICFENKEKVN